MKRTLVLTSIVGLMAMAFADLGGAAVADKDDKDEKEQEISISQLPAGIRKALKDIKVGQLAEIEREKDSKGRITYEIELRVGKHEVELELSADGKLLGVEIESADNDDDDDDRPKKAKRTRSRRDRDK